MPKQSQAIIQTPPLIVDRATAAASLSISERKLDELVAAGEIAAPVKISAGRVGWRWRDLVAFAESRPASDLLPPSRQAQPAAAPSA